MSGLSWVTLSGALALALINCLGGAAALRVVILCAAVLRHNCHLSTRWTRGGRRRKRPRWRRRVMVDRARVHLRDVERHRKTSTASSCRCVRKPVFKCPRSSSDYQ